MYLSRKGRKNEKRNIVRPTWSWAGLAQTMMSNPVSKYVAIHARKRSRCKNKKRKTLRHQYNINPSIGPKARRENPKVPQQSCRAKAKGNDYLNEMGPTSIIFLSFLSPQFFDLGLGPTSATTVFMDWMIKGAPHVESETKGLSNHNKRKPFS